MNNLSYNIGVSKPFTAYPKGDFDIESGTFKKSRRRKISLSAMVRNFRDHAHHFIKLRPIAAVFSILLFLAAILIIGISVVNNRSMVVGSLTSYNLDRKTPGSYPFQNLRNLVMVAGHSIYTSNSCGKVDQEDSWFLEPYQKHPGQAATFVAHIQEGVTFTDRDDDALLLFSGGETRKDAGPKSEAQSYWGVAESKGWFGKEESVRHRALTEEHARDSFENLLFSVCRFRELTGVYPQNITVVSYDFKEERFAHLHRAAIGFPETNFLYIGTPVSFPSREAIDGEASVRALFEQDPFGCTSSLHWKKIGRDPFHRTIPYPNGCPELKELFSYCGTVPYQGNLPWNH